MTLQAINLNLVQLSLADLKDIHELHSLPETDEFNTLGMPVSIHDTELLVNKWIKDQHAFPRASYIFCMKHIETGQFMGLIALILGKLHYKIAKVWYKTHPAFWKQGHTTKALEAILKFGFKELGLHRIEAGCAVENIASIKVLEKVGMTREGRKRKIPPIRGEWVDNFNYAILDTDYHEVIY